MRCLCVYRVPPVPCDVYSLPSNQELQVSSILWVLVYRWISLLRIPPPPPPLSILVSLLSPSVFPASLLVSPLWLKIPDVLSL